MQLATGRTCGLLPSWMSINGRRVWQAGVGDTYLRTLELCRMTDGVTVGAFDE